eukprot:gene780-10509_t
MSCIAGMKERVVIMIFLCCSLLINAAKRNSTELTDMLRNIMKNYDKRVLPTKDGKAAVVMLQMYIGDMVPVENIHMHYSMDLYLRAFWYDYRLDLPLDDGEQFPLNGQFTQEIWTPDIYFPTGKKGKMHDITRPNSLIRIMKNGLIRSSQRVSITNFCAMDLGNFPFDTQLCKFFLEPYSYNNEQCKLAWSYEAGGPLFYPEDLMMFEFTLHDIKVTNTTSNYGIFGMFDSLIVEFHLRRNINYYLLQNYFPTALVVILSWVGFWIDYRSTPARVALGITTVLTITTLANSIRSTLPPVSYSKSIDYYLLACFLFVFAALVEFAVVGITDLKWKGQIEKPTKKRSKKRAADRNGNKLEISGENGNNSGPNKKANGTRENDTIVTAINFPSTTAIKQEDNLSIRGSRANEAFVIDHEESKDGPKVNPRMQNWSVEEDKSREETSGVSEDEQVNDARDMTERRLSVSIAAIVKARQLAKALAEKHKKDNENHMIDKMCRWVFPFSFVLFNGIYFAVVLTSNDKK